MEIWIYGLYDDAIESSFIFARELTCVQYKCSLKIGNKNEKFSGIVWIGFCIMDFLAFKVY